MLENAEEFTARPSSDARHRQMVVIEKLLKLGALVDRKQHQVRVAGRVHVDVRESVDGIGEVWWARRGRAEEVLVARANVRDCLVDARNLLFLRTGNLAPQFE